MKKDLVNEIILLLGEIEDVNSRKFIARGFTRRGFNKSRAYELMKNKSLLSNANSTELLIFAYEINQLSEKKIDVSKFFDANTIEEFENIKLLDEYIPSNYDEKNTYEANKLLFINESYSNENTKRTFWHLYKTLIQDTEKKLNKDLCEFSLIQLEDLIRCMNVAITTKRNLLAFIHRYNEWCVLDELVEGNNLEGVDLKSLLTAPGANKDSNYISFEELYKNGIWLENKSDNDIIMLDVLIALLMRSGLRTSEIVDMRYSDVDADGNVEFESNGRVIKTHLQNFILKIMKEVKDEVYLVGAAKRPLLIVDDHIVKILDPDYDKVKVGKNIKKRMSKFKSCYRALNENILINSAKFDDLDLILAEQGTVTINDYKNIQVKYGNSGSSSYQKLREDYEMYIKNKQEK